MDQKKRIEVVAAVLETSGEVLCVRRGPNPRTYISGKWEFPGGKVEPGENHGSALAREIEEELRVSIVVGERLVTMEHSYPDFLITMHAYRCALVDDRALVTLTEHVDLKWMVATDPGFGALDWAAADLPIVDLLQNIRASK
jgi:8-oxo-dGTP diphosphatase